MQHPYAKGTRVRKINSERGDGHQDGDLATVISVIEIPHPVPTKHGMAWGGYFVHWDDMPDIPVFTGCLRVEAVEEEE